MKYIHAYNLQIRVFLLFPVISVNLHDLILSGSAEKTWVNVDLNSIDIATESAVDRYSAK